MNDVPERIWIEDERSKGGSRHVYDEETEGAIKYGVGYIYEDVAANMVATALREAAEQTELWVRRAMHLSSDGYEIERNHGHMAKQASAAILALIPRKDPAELARVETEKE